MAFSVPLVLASCPSEVTVPSKSAMPEIPAAGSMNPDGGQVHLLHGNLGFERSVRGVVGVDGAGFAVEFQTSARRQLCRHLERETKR